ncbi:phosphodiester glycosidase family protein [Phytoactinopolyspora halotolerans]|uniref:Multidrug transporter n=1 Tax=Phytoactinopolyspora halotolerans TaxID=1981512 RepID=A0A6L9S3V7_9ACTN|nr:phosphodiester glycosidase family protein [Phytoactinopolyspora halotolerans]NED99520.1 multidrug transporter [Phytoactinopolyspora halotolerans]
MLAAAAVAGAGLILAPVAGAYTADPAPAGAVIGAPGDSVPVQSEELSIAPGMELTTFSSLEADGWTSGSVLAIDAAADVTFDYQFSGEVTQQQTVRAGAERDGATAAINGDFFDINNSYAPLGVGMSRDLGVVNGPSPGRNQAVAVTESGALELAQIFLEGEVAVDGDAAFGLDGVNTYRLPAGGVGVFTSVWGDYTRAESVGGSSTTAEVTVVDGVVTDVGTEIGGGEIAENTQVFVGREAGAEALLALEPGMRIDVTYGLRSDVDDIVAAVGGNQVLVKDGEPQTFSDTAVHPRTALGVSEDGSQVFMVVIDGRQAHARGMSLAELGEFMHSLGAHDALNLDGGGSSTMVVRDPATPDHDVVNSPSDGSERQVSNGLAIFAGGGTGTLAGFRMSTEANSERVFPGLSRTVSALGHDEAHDPVEAAPSWTAEGDAVEISGDGATAKVTGVQPGEAKVVASEGDAVGELEITVLDELAWIDPSATLVPLADADSTGRIELTGYDAAGFRTTIEPADLEVSGGDGVVELIPDTTGYTVDPLSDDGSALLTFAVDGVEAQVAVTVGLVEETVADFSDAADWTVSFARASGTIEPTEGPDGRSGVRMSYDFTGPNTRAAYAAPPERFELPGQPQTVNAWVEGDGNGSWIRMRLYDAQGTLITLNGGYTTFTGWQKLSFSVPEGTQYPLTFRDIYSVEPRGDARYNGETSFSDISVEIAPDVELPSPERFEDPVVITDGTNDDATQRIAVMNDAQFVGRNPDSDIVAAARRTLREIVAADPDVLIINGDFVDEAAPEDFALARKILDEELGEADFPWYYVPGNHEIQGGPIENFIEEFGDTQHIFDIDGTRVVTLNTAYGTLRAGGREFDQILALREALDDAAEDPSVTGVVVAGHHPPNDPLPTANSQLADRMEAAMLETWLADFEAESGKQAIYVGGHAGVFDASSVDGVPYLVVGNSGKGPASTPDNGGFTGWTLLGIQPQHADHPQGGRASGGSSGGKWLSVEILPRVDTLTLDVPGRLPVGQTGEVSAEVVQDDGARTVPVEWPVSADWSGRGVHVGDPEDAEPGDFVALDPATGTLTALKAGATQLSVTVNGETATERIQVSPR